MTQMLRYGACKIPLGWYWSLIQSCAEASHERERESKRAKAFVHLPLGLSLEKQVNTRNKVLWQCSGILGTGREILLPGSHRNISVMHYRAGGNKTGALRVPAPRCAAENPKEKF